MPEQRTDGTQEKPEGRKYAIDRMGDRKRFPIAHNTGHLSTDLIWAERPFHFRLVISDEIESIRSDAADPVEHKDALIAAVENDIAAVKPINRRRFDDGFIPSGNKKGVHTVALRF